jgi:hypothetical protein
MSEKKFYVKNLSKTQGCYNLVSVNEKGRRQSLILSRNETSRALTEEEFNSPEVQKGLTSRGRDLLDVSKKMNA